MENRHPIKFIAHTPLFTSFQLNSPLESLPFHSNRGSDKIALDLLKKSNRHHMDNKQKLEFILKLERRDKRRRIIWLVLAIFLIGGMLVYAQYRNFQPI